MSRIRFALLSSSALLMLPSLVLASEPVVVDSVSTFDAPWQQSWREAVRQLPGVSARAHARTGMAFGPALFSIASPGAATRVTLDGLPLTDPWTGDVNFELPLSALSRLALQADGSLALETRRAGERPLVTAGVSSEAASPPLGDLAAAGRERYDLTLAGRRATAAGTFDALLSGRARAFADREPRFVARPNPFDEAPALGAASYADGRLPGNALEGASGFSRIGWSSRGDRWRATWAGGQTRDDWREYEHAYLFDAAHMPRTVNQWRGGTLALERRGAIGLTLRGTRTESRSTRGDGVWFDDITALARAAYTDPGINYDAPFFWRPGHRYGRFDRHRTVYSEWMGVAQWRPAPRQLASVRAFAQAWESRAYTINIGWLSTDSSGNPNARDSDGYGYDVLARETSGGTRRPRMEGVALEDEWSAPGGIVATGTLGASVLHAPVLKTIVDAFGRLHMVSTGEKSEIFVTPALELRQVRADGRTWMIGARRVVNAASGRELAETTGGELDRGWEEHLVYELPVGEYGRVHAGAFLHELDGIGGMEAAYVDGGNSRGLDISFTHAERGFRALRVNVEWSRTEFERSALSQRDIAWTGTGAPTTTVFMDDDHALRVSATGTWWLGGTADRRDWRFDTAARAESGAPYTPYSIYNEVAFIGVAGHPPGDLNSRRMPWTFTLDCSVARTFRLGGIEWQAAAQLYNVLNRHNVANVYGGTGSADETGWLATEDGQAYLAVAGETGRRLFELAQHDPSHWERPRTLTLTLRASY